ncbi:MAG: hypothetical protein EP336_01115 [Rhodobacteraceae bacterium]|nr:MAG: hypothetical protein EP336_01115 [Paracoccaceae bacterium]
MTLRGDRRVLLHAGFHKTGTTSLQKTFEQNRHLLDPHVETYLRYDFRTGLLVRPVRKFAAQRNKAAKEAILEEATLFFTGLDHSDPRPVFISHENLSGTYIGKDRVASYAAAPIAAKIIQDAWRSVTGGTHNLEFLYSTRRTGWIASCHWQRVITDRETRDLAQYEKQYAHAADLDIVVDRIRDAVAPGRVHSFAIEGVRHPALSALEHLGLGALWPGFDISDNQHTALDGATRTELLALNRSPLKGPEFYARRSALLGLPHASAAEGRR